MSSGSKKRPSTLDLQVINARHTPVVSHKNKNENSLENINSHATDLSTSKNVRASLLRRWFHFERKQQKQHQQKQEQLQQLVADNDNNLQTTNFNEATTSHVSKLATVGPINFTKSSISLDETRNPGGATSLIKRSSTQPNITIDVPEPTVSPTVNGLRASLVTFINKLAKFKQNSFSKTLATTDVPAVTTSHSDIPNETLALSPQCPTNIENLEKLEVRLDDINETKSKFVQSKENSIRDLSQIRRRRSSYFFSGNLN